MGVARESVVVQLSPGDAYELWTDVGRWPTFIEGFARAVEVSPDWPVPGSKVVWQSIPGGRGRVTEKVLESEEGQLLSTQVYEEALSGTQKVRFEPSDDADRGSRVTLDLDYELTNSGVLRAIADVVFIRRALAQSLGRTLRRFATEAAELSAL
jgi:uncharacterized membrane protein